MKEKVFPAGTPVADIFKAIDEMSGEVMDVKGDEPCLTLTHNEVSALMVILMFQEVTDLISAYSEVGWDVGKAGLPTRSLINKVFREHHIREV